MKRICTICARGGSKGVKNKNVLSIAGKPLVAHSINQAKDTGLFDVIAVSSDSNIILEVARKYGAECILRPDELSSDNAAKLPAICHCVSQIEEKFEMQFDVIVDLDATSPLRLPKDIINAVALLEREKVSNVITATPSRRSPYFNMIEYDQYGKVRVVKQLEKPLIRRQDAPETFDMNASIYVWSHDGLFGRSELFHNDTKMYLMPDIRSIDIDTPLDFQIVKFIMESRINSDGREC